MILGSMTNTINSSIRLIISYVLKMQSKFIFHFPATFASKKIWNLNENHFSYSIQMRIWLSNFNIYLYEYITIQAQRQIRIFQIRQKITYHSRKRSIFEYHYNFHFRWIYCDIEILLRWIFLGNIIRQNFYIFIYIVLRMLLLILEIGRNKNVLLSWKDHQK